MQKKQNNPATSMKCRFSNQVHAILEPNLGVKRSERWKKEYREKYNFSDVQKIEMFDKIFKLHQELSSELVAYRFDRSQKKRVQKARIERGYVPKKKTKLKDYVASKTA